MEDSMRSGTYFLPQSSQRTRRMEKGGDLPISRGNVSQTAQEGEAGHWTDTRRLVATVR